MESDPVWNRLCEAAAQEGSYACSCTDPFTMSWRRSPSSFRTIVPSMIGPWHVRACAFVFVRA